MKNTFNLSNIKRHKLMTIFSFIEQQVNVVKKFNRGERTHIETMIMLIQCHKSLMDHSPEIYAKGSECGFIEWANNQLENNKLPEESSGSFITALRDLDYILENFVTEAEYSEVINLARSYNL